MKRIIIIMSVLPGMVSAQNIESDSISMQQLSEVTVMADSQYTTPQKSVYFPDKAQREMAADGVSLLAGMSIPQLSVNILSESVNTVDNQKVDIFINFYPATKEDITGLQTSTVKRVEYYDFPTDPRFMRASHVVNFITEELSYGGYTKLSGKNRFFVRSGEAQLYSKMTCGKMTFDAMVSGQYDVNPHIGTNSVEKYILPDYSIDRCSFNQISKHKVYPFFIAGRATLSKGEKFSWRNTLSYSSENTPENSSSGEVYIKGADKAQNYEQNSRASGKLIDLNSQLFMLMGNNWSINTEINGKYIYNETKDHYVTQNTRIDNDADEKTWYLKGNSQLNKTINEKWSIFANLLAGGGVTKIDYYGSDPAFNKFHQFFTGCFVGTSFNVERVAGSIDAGYAFEANDINGLKMNDSYPFTHVSLQWAPDERKSINAWFQYASFSPDALMKNPNIIRQNELLYISGNPELKCSRHITSYLSFTWMPDNKLQLTVYASMFRIMGRQIGVYAPLADGNGILKKFYNDGNYNHGQLGANITSKLFNQRLVVSVAPRWLMYVTTGENSATYYPFSCSINAEYYFKRIALSAFWNSPWGYVDGDTAYKRHFASEYAIGISWANKGWNIGLTAADFFRSSWKLSTDHLSTKWYTCDATMFGAQYHRRITLNVAYTFSYGKKINNTSVLGNIGVSSSILR